MVYTPTEVNMVSDPCPCHVSEDISLIANRGVMVVVSQFEHTNHDGQTNASQLGNEG